MSSSIAEWRLLRSTSNTWFRQISAYFRAKFEPLVMAASFEYAKLPMLFLLKLQWLWVTCYFIVVTSQPTYASLQHYWLILSQGSWLEYMTGLFFIYQSYPVMLLCRGIWSKNDLSTELSDLLWLTWCCEFLSMLWCVCVLYIDVVLSM